MKLLSYAHTRDGLQALGSLSVRIGTKSPFSHTEILFEESDGVDQYMPDGTTTPKAGAYWMASATAADKIPEWSKRRAGKTGGVRFKRIDYNTDHWIVQDLPKELFDPVACAKWFSINEGHAYDWRQIFSFVGVIPNWIFSHSGGKFTCAEACAEALGFAESWRYHPANLPIAVHRMLGRFPVEWELQKVEAYAILDNSWSKK